MVAGPVGSSPRVRGKLVELDQGGRHRGLIPACAGKTSWPCRTRASTRAHPRVCGENVVVPTDYSDAAGSSPRVRGKPGQGGQGLERRRLIPACAGKTRRWWRRGRRCGAHPRVCGENRMGEQGILPAAGSSPRVRGKLLALGAHCPPRGLIPACAGKTQGFIPARAGNRAHPRVCGENQDVDAQAPLPDGSSPRVRGKLPRPRPGRRSRRLIPACAGKTRRRRACRRVRRAHPRVCGENRDAIRLFHSVSGSSPRVRGKLLLPERRGVRGRLIPACAGKTGGCGGAGGAPGAHPRVCGENDPAHPGAPPAPGSSPRVRGKLPGLDGHDGSPRLIPACAGKTEGCRRRWRRRTAHPRVCGENCEV